MPPDMVPPGAASPDNDVVPYKGELQSLDREPEAHSETTGPDERWVFWNRQIEAGLIHERRWRAEAREAERLYFGTDDDPGRLSEDEDEARTRAVDDKVALIHSNVEVLKPLLFSETPIPVVRRRFHGDGKVDETDLYAAEVGQRLATFLLDDTPFDDVMKAARDDWLIAGRGAARVRYEAKFETMQAVGPDGQMLALEIKADEAVKPVACEWARLVLAPGNWDSLPWLAFEVPMTRRQIEKRFGEDVAAQMSFAGQGLAGKSRNAGDMERDRTLDVEGETGEIATNAFDTASVWEIWCRDDNKVIWWSRSFKGGVLEEGPPPLDFAGFWPMPKPLLASVKGQSLCPRPDITYYAHLADEVRQAGEKLAVILDAVSVSGFAPAGEVDDLKKLLSGKSQIIPIKAWAQFKEKSSAGGIIEWLPLAPMMAAIQALITLREQAKQAMFEASGISDIMRAQGDPSETATAQQLKGRYAGLRLADRQRTMALYARDTLRLMLEVALEMFDTDRIAALCALDLPATRQEREMMALQQQMQMQQYQQLAAAHQQAVQMAEMAKEQGMQVQPPQPLPPPPEQERIIETSWEEVHARLKEDFGRKITISIETQSTVLADEQADKESRIEFLGAFAQFVQTLAPLAASGQFDMKVVKELLLFGVRGFPKSRTLEGLIASLPDEPKGEPPEETQVTVAKIRAEADRMVEEMRMVDRDKERSHDLRMKGFGALVDAEKMKADAPPPPEPPIEKERV